MEQKNRDKKVNLLGVYNYTVWLTYFGLFISIAGMMEGLHGRQIKAIFCLAISGLCDAFDGRIARKKTDRTEDEKAFGIQIDSLCDIVCFGVFPSVICFTLGVNGAAGMLVIAWYCICGVIRLAQFNVTAQGRLGETEKGWRFSRGLWRRRCFFCWQGGSGDAEYTLPDASRQTAVKAAYQSCFFQNRRISVKYQTICVYGWTFCAEIQNLYGRLRKAGISFL